MVKTGILLSLASYSTHSIDREYSYYAGNNPPECYMEHVKSGNDRKRVRRINEYRYFEIIFFCLHQKFCPSVGRKMSESNRFLPSELKKKRTGLFNHRCLIFNLI